jgi:hypothetical protein
MKSHLGSVMITIRMIIAAKLLRIVLLVLVVRQSRMGRFVDADL